MTNYQKYQLEWMIAHGYSLQDLMQALTEHQYDDPEDSDRISTPINELFAEWEQDIGFGSEIWACENEWSEAEGASYGEIRPGKYRHFKGKEYEVLCVANHTETCEPMVIYRALYGEHMVFARPISMWNETVTRDGKTYKRFTYIGEEQRQDSNK